MRKKIREMQENGMLFSYLIIYFILDTSIAINRIKYREVINEAIAVVTLIEYPSMLEYSGLRETLSSLQ